MEEEENEENEEEEETEENEEEEGNEEDEEGDEGNEEEKEEEGEEENEEEGEKENEEEGEEESGEEEKEKEEDDNSKDSINMREVANRRQLVWNEMAKELGDDVYLKFEFKLWSDLYHYWHSKKTTADRDTLGRALIGTLKISTFLVFFFFGFVGKKIMILLKI